jgi:hypothetical protein
MAAARVVEVERSELLNAFGIPARTIKLELGSGGRAFVFTMRRRDREKMDAKKFMQTAQSLGDVVHPARAVLVVLPDDAELRAYEVIAE